MKKKITHQLTLDQAKSVKIETVLQRLRILPISSLILLGILLSIIVLTAIWSAKEWIAIEARGEGMTISKSGLVQILSRTEGTVATFNVSEGQSINKGDLLAEIYHPESALKLQSTQIKLENLEKEYERLQKQIQIEGEALKKALKREIESNEFTLKQIKEQIQSLNEDLEVKKKFFNKGLISYNYVQQAEYAIVQQEIEEESIKEKLANLRAELVKSYRVEELRSKAREIEEQRKELAVLEARIKEEKIYSPVDGKVVFFLKDIGEVIKRGSLLLVLEAAPYTHDFVIYGYFSIETGKEIEVGTPVEIEFYHLREAEYGKMRGIVQNVSNYAVSQEKLLNTIYNKELIQRLTAGSSAVLEVVIAPLRNPNKPEEYLWVGKSHPEITITTGSLCALYATVEEKKPLYFVFPFKDLKRKPLLNAQGHLYVNTSNNSDFDKDMP